ncbi:MAG TPA: NRDE family protein [Thermoanaerobaculia bacterium]|nr:NRDE family protein [Thermoanaerobaculia bacterium]
MCLVVVAHRVSPRFPLIIAANRDEDHDRPALPAGWWTDAPDILGGRDALAGGTWLAVTRSGRFAAVTNLRFAARPSAPSRGRLVAEFLRSDAAPLAYLRDVETRMHDYAGFHLIAGVAGESVAYVTNAEEEAHEWAPGIHAVSNGTPDELWPKVEAGEKAMAVALERDDIEQELLRFLRTNHGRTPDREAFVLNERWGTRSSTVIIVSGGELTFIEQRWTRAGEPEGYGKFTTNVAP